MSDYDHDYPNEPIGGGNPYYRCVACKRSDPEINGVLERHYAYCEYRKGKESEARATVSDQQLRDRITELERALTPFANFADSIDPKEWDDARICFLYGKVLTAGHVRRAAEALKERP